MGKTPFKWTKKAAKEGKGAERRKRSRKTIGGKDYLTQKETAAYCCVSLRQFQLKAARVGLFPFTFMGKKVYKKQNLRDAMEDARWQACT